ncbi:MAG: DUF5752 family protein [Candidatus Zixiibacteriota bacterium]
MNEFPTEMTNMPFQVKDCALIARMAGINTAVNLRELRERLLRCPAECLFHHFCETFIRPAFDDPEFRNDFAVWASRDLQDRVLAEQLGIINPYAFDNIEQLRQATIDILDDRLSEMPHVPHVRRGNDFRFMRAVTVVFETDMELCTPSDLIYAIGRMSHGALYYHYIEARRRTAEQTDDFTLWLRGFGGGTEQLIQSLQSIDFYFMSLTELRAALSSTLYGARRELVSG